MAALRDRRLFAILALFAALLLLVAQAPLRLAFDVGREDGYTGDLPMLANFQSTEEVAGTKINFRWTRQRSQIRLPGAGQRALEVEIRLLSVNGEVAERGPRTVELWANDQRLGQLTVRPSTGGTYRILIPPPADGSGDRVLELRADTIKPTGDTRSIATPVDAVRVMSVSGPSMPSWRSSLAWLGAALVLWLALRRVGLLPAVVAAALLGVVLLASLAALLDPVRFAFGSADAIVVASLGWLLVALLEAKPAGLLLAGLALLAPAAAFRALFDPADFSDWGGPGAIALAVVLALLLAGWLRPVLRALYERAAPPLPEAARRSLVLFALVVFLAHYGGKLYPEAMHGDIGFHANRLLEVRQGLVMLLSSNRGVPFPYPPALYLLLAPITLTGLDDRVLLQLTSALFDALSPFLLYTIVVCSLGHGARSRPTAQHSRLGLLAAGIYAFTAATLMTTWWNFSSHIFSQFAHLLLIAVLVVLWPLLRRPLAVRQAWPIVLALGVLQSFVYLGHFGFWMNMSLLGAFCLAVLLVGALRGLVAWSTWRLFLVSYVLAESFAALFFYSAYAGMFVAQAREAANAGLTGLADRQAVPAAILWRTLWEAGFQTHFGLFPVPLALCSLLLPWALSRRAALARSQGTSVLVLMFGTFAIALLFGSLPFLTGSTLATRWLMFSAWAVAVGAARVAQRFWQSGRAARWLVVVIGCYVLWGTASMWLNGLAWRIRPPEPF